MKLLLSKDIATEMERLLNDYSQYFIVSAWATTDVPVFDMFKKYERKIERCVIGTHFHQTSPDFIDSFRTHGRVRFITSPSGVFHPKVYLFKDGTLEWECIVGSANFTRGGLYSNDEICVLLTPQDSSGEFLVAIEAEIENFWNRACVPSSAWLEGYREAWKQHRPVVTRVASRHRQNLRQELVLDLIGSEWDEYYEAVTTADQHATEGRLIVLAGARKTFETYGRFNAMPDDARSAIAGYNSRFVLEEGHHIDWGWFGWMKGAGYFKQGVKENSRQLSQALDAIPMTGVVSEADYNKFESRFLKLGHYKNPLGTATRLLCMKRPDYFVGINSANRAELCKAFDARMTLTLDDYWGELVEKILATKWWRSQRPTDPQEAQVHDARAAFLDAIYYRPT